MKSFPPGFSDLGPTLATAAKIWLGFGALIIVGLATAFALDAAGTAAFETRVRSFFGFAFLFWFSIGAGIALAFLLDVHDHKEKLRLAIPDGRAILGPYGILMLAIAVAFFFTVTLMVSLIVLVLTLASR